MISSADSLLLLYYANFTRSNKIDMNLVTMPIAKKVRTKQTVIINYNDMKLKDVLREHLRQNGDACLDGKRSVDVVPLVNTAIEVYHLRITSDSQLYVYYYLWDQAKDLGLQVWEGRFGRIKIPENID